MELVVWREEGRKSSEVRVNVVPVEAPRRKEEPKTAERRPRMHSGGTTAFLTRRVGADLEPVTSARNSELGRKKGAGGVYVVGVEADSRADRAGLMAGDVIVEVDHRVVGSLSDVADAVRSAGREFVPLLVERDGSTRGLSLEQP